DEATRAMRTATDRSLSPSIGECKAGCLVGWRTLGRGGRDRTGDHLLPKQIRYRCATPRGRDYPTGLRRGEEADALAPSGDLWRLGSSRDAAAGRGGLFLERAVARAQAEGAWPVDRDG